MKVNILFLFLVPFVLQCGSKKTDNSQGQISTPSATSLIADSEASTAFIASSLSELSTLLTSGDTLGVKNASFNLDSHIQLADSGSIDFTSVCTEDANAKTATVAISFAGTETKTKAKITVGESAGGIETRVWSNTITNAPIKCASKGLYAAIDWKNVDVVNGLQLQVNSQRTRNFGFGFDDKNGDFKRRTLTSTENGSRTIQWQTLANGTDTTYTLKTLKVNMDKTQVYTKLSGENVNLSGIFASVTDDPISSNTVRNASAVPISHTIYSGSMTVTKEKQFYITNQFDNLFFDLSKDDPCTPVTGSIKTSVYKAATDTNPVQTYEISFTAGVPTIKGDTEASFNLFTNINHKCDFVGGQ